MKHLFLSGGGTAEESSELDHLFIASLNEKKILYMPNAMEYDLRRYEECNNWIVSTLSIHTDEFVDIRMATDLTKINEEHLFSFSGIYIGGGNTYRLQKALYSNRFNHLLRAFINEGRVVYGGSAGAIILGDRIDCHDDEMVSSVGMKGLHMVGPFSIACHFNPQQYSTIEKYSRFYRTPVIALAETNGIEVKDDQILTLGTTPIVCFQQNGEHKQLPIHTYHTFTSLLG